MSPSDAIPNKKNHRTSNEVHLKIFGDVHGVGFRYATLEKAQALGLRGFVKNLPDGTVEIVAQGNKEQLEKLVKWAEGGPAPAEVKKVEAKWRKPATIYPDFAIHREDVRG